MKTISDFIIKYRFMRFMFAGGIAAIINFTSRIFLSFYFNYVTAIVIAYIFGMVTAYILYRLCVFDPRVNTYGQQMGYFIIVNIFALLQTLAVSLLLANYVFIGIADQSARETLAHFFGVCFPVFTSYFGHKYITFK